jgi:glyoxylase-like metal-dependent hydrolase (beta-lactamase superfamily II)
MKTVFSQLARKSLAPIAVAAWMLTAGTAMAAAPLAGYQAPGYYRTTLGDYEVTVLSDGTAPREVANIMTPHQEVADAVQAAHEDAQVELSINTFLINTGNKLVLVDTGAGELFGPKSGGHLIANLRAAGYQPEQIDAILLTHIHGDHSGGLSMSGKRLFVNADVYVDHRDADFWLSAKEEAAHPERKTTFQQSHQTVDPYVKAGKLKTFDGATKLFPGISSLPAYGHTPGHSAYLIESKGKRLILWGDTIHYAEAQFADPTISIEYDVNHDAAIASREQLLSETASDGDLVGGAHISFPGLGHVKVEGKGYQWVALPYQALN